MSRGNGSVRRTVGADVYGEPWTYQPREVRVVRGDQITSDTTVRADVCVIGTGAGGAPAREAAKELAEGGMSVVTLETGDRFTTDDYTARPREMTSLLYRDAGQTATFGNAPIVLPMGEGIAGSTLINSGTCFRTPDVILESWGERFGLDSMGPAELDPYFRRVERELHVTQVPEEVAGNNALVIKRGAESLGWSGDFIFRNASGCVGSGVCNWGCPTSSKLHMGLTYIPRAWDAGLIAEAEDLLRRASRLPGTGRYQLEAAVQSAHVVRRRTGSADWAAIARIYDALFTMTGSPVVAINRAVAIAETHGADAALAALDALAGDPRLDDYQPYWAARAGVLARVGDRDAADVAYERAIGLETDPAVRRFLERRRAALGD